MVIHTVDFTVPVEDHAALLYIYIYYNILQRFFLGGDVIHRGTRSRGSRTTGQTPST